MFMNINSLPGNELIQKGLKDLSLNKITIESLLISIGSPRLRRNGYIISGCVPHSEHQLYQLLKSQFKDGAHSKYNSYIRKLISFERALECAT